MSTFTKEEQKILLNLVDQSIEYGLKHGITMQLSIYSYPKHLQERGASFITLELDGFLRGCIGTLEAHQPLIVDIVQNAYAAAFKDPRFIPVNDADFPRLVKHISILSKPEPIKFSSEQDLISKIKPNVDGLILFDRGRRGTFLPSVWESLPNPRDFLRQLKLKAGLPEDYWSDTIKVERYFTEVIE